MASQLQTLVACCECEDRHLLVRLITRIGLTASLATCTQHAVSILRGGSVFLVFCQDQLPDDGLQIILTEASRILIPVVVCSRFNDPNQYLESMRQEAFDFLCMPYYATEIAGVLAPLVNKYLSSNSADRTAEYR